MSKAAPDKLKGGNDMECLARLSCIERHLDYVALHGLQNSGRQIELIKEDAAEIKRLLRGERPRTPVHISATYNYEWER